MGIINADFQEEFDAANHQRGIHFASNRIGNNRRGQRGDNTPQKCLG